MESQLPPSKFNCPTCGDDCHGMRRTTERALDNAHRRMEVLTQALVTVYENSTCGASVRLARGVLDA